MSNQEELHKKYFTDFDGAFDGRLAKVVPIAANYDSQWAGSSARYDCRIKIRYNKELMAQLEEGMLLAVKNFKGQSKKSAKEGIERYTVMVISKVWPQHYGLGGVSDSHYYPMQMEIIEQSVSDWGTEDQATMMVQMTAIPINHDLVLDSKGEISFKKGFSYPLIGEEVFVINMETVDLIYNSKVKESIGFTKKTSVADPKKDPRVGVLRMFMESDEEVPIYVDLPKLLRYHFGVFSFTGGGKSNLLSNLFRRILYHSKDYKLVIFDISCEYPFLLADVIADPKIPCKVIVEEEATSADHFAKSIVKPRDFEDDDSANDVLKKLYDDGHVTFYNQPLTSVPTFGGLIEEIREMSAGQERKNAHYIQALNEALNFVMDWMEDNKKGSNELLDEEFIDKLSEVTTKAIETFNVHKSSGVFSWGTTRHTLKRNLARAKTATANGVTVKDMLKMLSGDERVICISIADPETLRELVIALTKSALKYRKRKFEIKPQILFVFDEAQEFIPSNPRGQLERCSHAVERLLRQGLQQLHTFFVGTLPRPYDRTVVSSSFQIDLSILDKTLEFPPGSWLLSSYIATGLDNVPVFVKADNSEDALKEYIESSKSKTPTKPKTTTK
ncbi:MAG: ATP-binding protein [Candidatus Thorarchaeota archaeon]